MGASKTVPPASTREETSSLQVSKASLRSETVIFDKCVLGNLAFHRQFREIQMMTWEEIAELLMSTAQIIAPVVPCEIRAPFGVCRALL